MDRIKVVYIAGSGRTGSTLLGLLLAQAPETWNVGQIRDLALAVSRQARCACENWVSSCPFWSRVVAEAGLGEPSAAERVDRLRKDFILSDPWKQPANLSGMASPPHPYVELLRRIYASAHRAAEGRVLIDSSKTPEIALGLSLLPEVDLTVIHLTRDPRAVACSWYRKLADMKRTIGFCHAWRQRVRVMNTWAAWSTIPIVQVRYESFAKHPQAELARIWKRSGLRENAGLWTDDGIAKVSWEGQHLFPPANEAVLARKETRVHIRATDDWRKPAHLGLHFKALRHTFPEGLEYCLSSRWGTLSGRRETGT